MNDKKKLDLLDDMVVVDILSMSEADLRAAVSDSDVEAAKADFERAKALLGKSKLVRAKVAVADYREGANVVSLRRKDPTADIGLLRREDKDLNRDLTLAARKGNAGMEADAAGIEEDFAELAAWEEEDRKKT